MSSRPLPFGRCPEEERGWRQGHPEEGGPGQKLLPPEDRGSQGILHRLAAAAAVEEEGRRRSGLAEERGRPEEEEERPEREGRRQL